MREDDAAGVVHALIEDLAAGKLVETSTFQLTEEQTNVKIPNYLIYLAGLIGKPSSSLSEVASSGSAPSLTTQDNEKFESLQKIFAEFNKAEMPLFRLSPRLCPTEGQLVAIRTDFERKHHELENKARQAAEDLLSAELQSNPNNGVVSSSSNIKSKTKKKKNKTNNKSNSTRVTATSSNSHDENLPPPTFSQDQSTSVSTLEQVISQIQTESSTLEDDSDASAWIPVSKSNDKTTSTRKYQPVKNQNATMEPPSNTNDDKDQLESSHHAAGTIISHLNSTDKPDAGTNIGAEFGSSGTSSLKDQSLSSDKRTFAAIAAAEVIGEVPKLKTETDALNTAEKSPVPTSVDLMKERIRQLEEAVKEKGQELQREKQASAKMLSQKQQQFDDQVQALQLRLYISETRLKTFEEALEQHVQAVASNVATSMECTTDTTGRSILHQYSSRNKGRISQSNQAKEEEAPSPLISRLLSRQKSLSENPMSSGS